MSNILDLLSLDIDDRYFRVKQATRLGYILCEWGGCCDLSYPTSKLRRGRVQGSGQISPTLLANTTNIYRVERGSIMSEKPEDWAIRKFTPTETMRLMGFNDDDVIKCRAVGISNVQLYRQSGNSIVTNCIELIAEHLYKAQYDDSYKCYDEKSHSNTNITYGQKKLF